MDDEAKRAIALFRVGVLGPLVSARLERGDRTAYFLEAASRRHVMPAAASCSCRRARSRPGISPATTTTSPHPEWRSSWSEGRGLPDAGGPAPCDQ